MFKMHLVSFLGHLKNLQQDILLCRICAARADIFHKIAHEKYNLFAICTRRVGEHQKEMPGKSSTDILNDLLAENNWVDEVSKIK